MSRIKFSCLYYFQGLVIYSALIQVSQAQLTIQCNLDGSYAIFVNKLQWLNSAPTFFRANNAIYSTADGSLKQFGPPIPSDGWDKFGLWNALTFNYSTGGSTVATNVREYNDNSMAIFTQTFVDGLGATSSKNPNGVISGFPSFQISTPTDVELGYLAYCSDFIGWYQLNIGRWRTGLGHFDDGMDSGPLILFDKTGSVLIISPFTQFMTASYAHDVKQGTISWGIMGSVNAVTSGYSISTIVYHSNQGINKAIEDWGRKMRFWYDRSTASRDLDISVNYLGYYTDNGAYYYQVPEKGMNFEETLLGEYKYFMDNGLPYRYIQYDDWFYPVVGPTGYGATVTWDAKPNVFPHGLVYLYNKTLMPVVAHNRYWSDKTTYAKQNGGRFNFIFAEQGNSLPDDQAFWDYLFSTAKMWGLVTYEQDWLNYQSEMISALYSDLTLGTRWLKQMGAAATKYGLTIQYCMALSRHALASLEIPAVSQIRVSIDYTMSPHQYQIGVSSMFSDAMGLAPFKDNFWSWAVQPGNRYGKFENNTKLQAIVSLLSTGPVGVSDKIGYTDVDLVKRLAAADGLLLKTSKPATAIDAQILQSAFGGDVGPVGEVWTTYSDISGLVFGVIFAVELQRPYFLRHEQTGFRKLEPSYVYSSEYFMPLSKAPARFDSDNPLYLDRCSNYTSMCLYYTSPILHLGDKLLFLAGEMDKAVPMSIKRVSSIIVASYDIHVELTGTPGEVVHFDVCGDVTSDVTNDVTNTIQCSTIPCTISGDSKAVLSVARRICFGG